MILNSANPQADERLLEQLLEELERVFAIVRGQLTSPIPEVEELCRQVEAYRGKMLRPVLALLSASSIQGTALERLPEDVRRVAAVVEMIHLATLIHDDVLDDADTRRGAPTIARMRSNEIAVILGDFLLSQAFHLCATIDDQRTAMRVGEITSAVCEGEMLQLSRRGQTDLDERTYYTIVERKTAFLIAVACELGASHAGATAEQCDALFEFGTDIGVAFQVQDDLLDLVGDQDVVGKSLGKDIEMGKVTLPVLHHLQQLSGPDRERMQELIRTQRPLNGSRASVVSQLEATGSIDYARAAARERVASAKARLNVLPDSQAKDQLLLLADQVIDRSL